MMRLRYLFLLLLTTGCAGNVRTLRDLQPAGDDFAHALASEYQAYSESEQEQGRFFSADYFAGKGLAVLKGEKVDPDAPDNSLPEAAQQELASGRAKLMGLMNDSVKDAAPQKLARAQLLFDCWQHEVSRDLSQEKAPCGAAFKAVLADVMDEAGDVLYDEQTVHTIEFAEGSAKLSAKNVTVIKKLAKQLHHHAHYALEIEAHSEDKDTVALGEARLNNIKKTFMQAGVAASHIQLVNEDDSKKVFLSSDEVPGERNHILVTVKTRKSEQGA